MHYFSYDGTKFYQALLSCILGILFSTRTDLMTCTNLQWGWRGLWSTSGDGADRDVSACELTTGGLWLVGRGGSQEP